MDNVKISSQNNVHPGRPYISNDVTLYSDPRVLTLYELMLIMTIPENWNLPKDVSRYFVRRLIGEGIPPKFIAVLFSLLLTKIRNGWLYVLYRVIGGNNDRGI